MWFGLVWFGLVWFDLICLERKIFKNISERKNIIKDSPSYKKKFGKSKKEVKHMFIQIFLLPGKLNF